MKQARGFVGRLLPHKKGSKWETLWTQMLPFLALILYWVTGGIVFYLLQKYALGLTVSFASQYYEPDGRCSDSTVYVNYSDPNRTRVFGKPSFGRAFFYVSTIYSSIGYGTTAPCTWVGKLMTVIFASTGVPLTLLCLGRLGRFLRQLCDKIWNQMVLRKEPRAVSLEETHIPLYVGIFITGIWITLTAFVFWHLMLDPIKGRKYPQSWTYFDALYFTVISFFTIGLGDYAPERYLYIALHFLFIFIGLSLVSMCISIAQINMESQFDKMVNMIQAVYEQQKQWKDQDGEGVRHSDPFNPEDENAARLVLSLWKSGGLMASMMKRGSTDTKSSTCPRVGTLMTRLMVEQWKRKTFNRTRSTQTSSADTDVGNKMTRIASAPEGFCPGATFVPKSVSIVSTPCEPTLWEGEPIHVYDSADTDGCPIPSPSVNKIMTVAHDTSNYSTNAAMV